LIVVERKKNKNKKELFNCIVDNNFN